MHSCRISNFVASSLATFLDKRDGRSSSRRRGPTGHQVSIMRFAAGIEIIRSRITQGFGTLRHEARG
jgi:hypothetical protein